VLIVRPATSLMTEHKFKIGQIVYYHPDKSGPHVYAPSGLFQVTRRLPAKDAEFQYWIKSTFEDHDRVAKESELTRA